MKNANVILLLTAATLATGCRASVSATTRADIAAELRALKREREALQTEREAHEQRKVAELRAQKEARLLSDRRRAEGTPLDPNRPTALIERVPADCSAGTCGELRNRSPYHLAVVVDGNPVAFMEAGRGRTATLRTQGVSNAGRSDTGSLLAPDEFATIVILPGERELRTLCYAKQGAAYVLVGGHKYKRHGWRVVRFSANDCRGQAVVR